MLTLGVDIGSSASKCVLLSDGKSILSSAISPIGAGTKGPQKVMEETLAKAGKSLPDVAFVMATGYGRNTLKEASAQMSELSCHARGVYAQFPNARTIVDIGGQDAKAITLNADGRMLQFLMNDKCAAGTGRFLSVMANVLDVPIENFAHLAAMSTKKVEISSTCTVFAESEVISLLANGLAVEDIIAAIHRSIASRVGSLVLRLGVNEEVVMTGGVAQDAGVVKELSGFLNSPIAVSPFAQLNGAYGAAILAYEKASHL